MLKDSLTHMKKQRSFTVPKILLYLALNKPSSKWGIAKVLGKSYGNVHATIQDLLAYRLIRVKERKPSARNKMEVDYYGITLEGLMLILSQNEGIDVIDKIAEQQNSWLPLVLGKWSFYQRTGFKELVTRRMEKVAREEVERFLALADLTKVEQDPNYDDIEKMLLGFAKIEQKEGLSLNPGLTLEGIREQLRSLKKAHQDILEAADLALAESITKNVLLYSLNLLIPEQVEAQKQFLSTLRKDKELAFFVKTEYETLKKRYESYLESIRSFLKEWKNERKD